MHEPTEEAFLKVLRENPGDLATRAAYADWLEARGDIRHRYLRVEEELHRLLDGEPEIINGEPVFPDDALHLAPLLQELDTLSWKCGAEWMRLVTRVPIRNCRQRHRVACPRTWAALAPTDDDAIRRCMTCFERVYFAETTEEAKIHAYEHRHVAIAAWEPCDAETLEFLVNPPQNYDDFDWESAVRNVEAKRRPRTREEALRRRGDMESNEETFLDILRQNPRDFTTRMVYADWLEARGDIRYRVLRIEDQIARLASAEPEIVNGEPVFDEHATEIARLNQELARWSPLCRADWLHLVSLAPIRNCTQKLRSECPGAWDALAPTLDRAVRHCRTCRKKVWHCSSAAEIREHTTLGHCVAFADPQTCDASLAELAQWSELFANYRELRIRFIDVLLDDVRLQAAVQDPVEAAFLAAIREDRADFVARYNFTNWLGDRGDPRHRILQLEAQIDYLEGPARFRNVVLDRTEFERAPYVQPEVAESEIASLRQELASLVVRYLWSFRSGSPAPQQ